MERFGFLQSNELDELVTKMNEISDTGLIIKNYKIFAPGCDNYTWHCFLEFE